MSRKPPMSHKIIIPKPYVPSGSTDIRKTIAAEKRRLAEEATRKATVKPLRRVAG